jgi:hypothetical protein
MGPNQRTGYFAQEIAMSNSLTRDEMEALEQIAKGPKGDRVSACIARNAKRLGGLKYVAYGKDGQLALTDKGKQTLFLNNCIKGLEAVCNDPLTPLSPDVALFLGKKGHIRPIAAGGFEITQKGRESLADIAATSSPAADTVVKT